MRAKLVAAVAGVVALGAVGAAALAQGGPGPERGGFGFHEARGGWGGWHGHGGPMRHLCDAERRAGFIEARLDLVESFAEFSPEQQAAWQSLRAAVRTADGRVGAACEQLRAEGRPASAPERLARAETMMSAGLEVVRELRPALDAFYTTLSDEQRRALDRVLGGRHRRG